MWEALLEFVKHDKWIALVCVLLLSGSSSYSAYQSSQSNETLIKNSASIETLTQILSDTNARSIRNQEAIVKTQEGLIDMQRDQNDFQQKMWASISSIVYQVSEQTADRWTRTEADRKHIEQDAKLKELEKLIKKG